MAWGPRISTYGIQAQRAMLEPSGETVPSYDVEGGALVDSRRKFRCGAAEHSVSLSQQRRAAHCGRIVGRPYPVRIAT